MDSKTQDRRIVCLGLIAIVVIAVLLSAPVVIAKAYPKGWVAAFMHAITQKLGLPALLFAHLVYAIIVGFIVSKILAILATRHIRACRKKIGN